jgi:hypothetical protein
LRNLSDGIKRGTWFPKIFDFCFLLDAGFEIEPVVAELTIATDVDPKTGQRKFKFTSLQVFWSSKVLRHNQNYRNMWIDPFMLFWRS